MSDEQQEPELSDLWGPVDYLVAVAPVGADASAGLTQLLALVDAGQVRVLDIELFESAADGVAEVSQDRWESLLGTVADQFFGACSGLLDEDDRAELAAVVGEGEFAVVVVYESLITNTVVSAWQAAGVRVVDAGPLGAYEIEVALTATEELA